jgi:hypothetical protein|uniref:Uncharacterized protein n=1 Tax=viral metagenome TaxID=1070528 RepID=A0A6C0CYK4_9ZZZZ
MENTVEKADNIMNGVLLLILAISGNFIAETLGCKTQKLLTENMLAKHVVILFIIYVSLGFASESNPNPMILLRNSVSIWVLFLLFTKMSLKFNIFVFALVVLYHFINTYINYYSNKDKKKYKKEIDNYNKILNYLKYLIIGSLIVGFVLYFNKQRNDYSKNWSTFNFIFGVNKCKSLQ